MDSNMEMRKTNQGSRIFIDFEKNIDNLKNTQSDFNTNYDLLLDYISRQNILYHIINRILMLIFLGRKQTPLHKN